MSRTIVRTINELRQEVSKGVALFDVELLQALVNELSEHPDPAAASAMYTAKGMMHRIRDESEEALSSYKKAVDEYQKLGDRSGMAGSITNIGAVYADAGDFATAYEYFNEALKLHVETGNRLFEANTLHNIGMIHVDSGGYSQGVDFLNRALEIYEELGDDHAKAIVIGHLGTINRQTGDEAAASEKFTHALEVYLSAGDKMGVAQMLCQIADIHASNLELEEALAKYQEAQNIYKHQGASDRIVGLNASIYTTLFDLKRYAEAAPVLEELNGADIRHQSTTIARFECNAKDRERLGDLQGAHHLLEEALRIARDHEMLGVESGINRRLRDLAYRRRDIDAYVQFNDEFLRLQQVINSKETAQKMAMNEAQQRISQERAERERERAILFSTLPEQIAERLVKGESVSGDLHSHVAVLFVDIAEFTAHSEHLEPEALTDLIEGVFARFDDLAEMYDLTKIKTIGDSYMAVAFASPNEHSSAQHGITVELRAVRCALDMLNASFQWPNGERIQFRAGVHCGPVVAGVIGSKRIQYDVWGDTVNVASRMESTGDIGKVQITQACAALLDNTSVSITERGQVEVKGKGLMTTYWLE